MNIKIKFNLGDKVKYKFVDRERVLCPACQGHSQIELIGKKFCCPACKGTSWYYQDGKTIKAQGEVVGILFKAEKEGKPYLKYMIYGPYSSDNGYNSREYDEKDLKAVKN